MKGKERVNVSEFRQTRALPKLSNPLKDARIFSKDEFFKSRRDSLKLGPEAFNFLEETFLF